MKKVLALGILGILVAFAFALGTSATFRDYRAQRSSHIAVVADDVELIDLHPGQPYAYINYRGKLVIDFSMNNPNWPGWEDPDWWDNETPIRGLGLSPQSRYNFDHVFYVSNDLWENVTIVVEVISSDPGTFSFYDPTKNMYVTGTNTKPYNSDTAAGDVCFVLAPGEELGVGMELATGGFGLGDFYGNVTIKAWPLGDQPFVCGGVK
ncbi:hypothetical protein PAP_09345 [Palaeococcus pacificus DY20341]|uniref:DUF1102 domain-containing protein n=1 Tax=Palaeococcus pacificus DY20341 TaxID=1343739 RepID=A0A075LW45_9EURY|nr:DUF1102 domain-containing protein [Palaeococcus pacificus]AIF70247.1 hypothetical protein PAP_09345 [Palaeococcus pacificus DY20341]